MFSVVLRIFGEKYNFDKLGIEIMASFVYNVRIVVLGTPYDQRRAEAFPKGEQYICTQLIPSVISVS